MQDSNKEEWDLVISPKTRFINLNFKELFKYKDLIVLFIKRDFIANYKQTILGPLWHVIQPVLTTLTFAIIFGGIAGLSTDGTPRLLFYMTGIICWNYFALCLTKTSTTFVSNAHIFGKVYFPRLTIPVSVVISNLLSFLIQFVLLGCFMLYYVMYRNYDLQIGTLIFLIPYLLFIIAILGLGAGIIISSLTTKYRDLAFLVGFGTQLLMYVSTVIFPLTSIEGKLKTIILLNPMSAIVETMRCALLGKGEFEWKYIAYSSLFALLIFILGLIMFNRVEKSFNDTV